MILIESPIVLLLLIAIRAPYVSLAQLLILRIILINLFILRINCMMTILPICGYFGNILVFSHSKSLWKFRNNYLFLKLTMFIFLNGILIWLLHLSIILLKSIVLLLAIMRRIDNWALFIIESILSCYFIILSLIFICLLFVRIDPQIFLVLLFMIFINLSLFSFFKFLFSFNSLILLFLYIRLNFFTFLFDVYG